MKRSFEFIQLKGKLLLKFHTDTQSLSTIITLDKRIKCIKLSCFGSKFSNYS